MLSAGDPTVEGCQATRVAHKSRTRVTLVLVVSIYKCAISGAIHAPSTLCYTYCPYDDRAVAPLLMITVGQRTTFDLLHCWTNMIGPEQKLTKVMTASTCCWGSVSPSQLVCV